MCYNSWPTCRNQDSPALGTADCMLQLPEVFLAQSYAPGTMWHRSSLAELFMFVQALQPPRQQREPAGCIDSHRRFAHRRLPRFVPFPRHTPAAHKPVVLGLCCSCILLGRFSVLLLRQQGPEIDGHLVSGPAAHRWHHGVLLFVAALGAGACCRCIAGGVGSVCAAQSSRARAAAGPGGNRCAPAL